MAEAPIRIHDDASLGRFADPFQGTVEGRLLEISSKGATFQVELRPDVGSFLDLTLVLKGQAPRQFFASVEDVQDGRLRIAWLHADPGQHDRLRQLLQAFRNSDSSHHSSRRLVRPKSMDEVVPFGGEPEPEPVPSPAPASSSSARIGTRRVLRATSTPTVRPDLAASLSEDKQHQVVIAPTDRYVKLRDKADEPNTAPTSEQTGPEERTPSGGTRMAVGSDGRMDIAAALRSKSKTVRASELAARHDKVRVLNMATIKALIQEAVEEAANHLGRALGEAERNRLLEEAEEDFKERLKSIQADQQNSEQRAAELAKQLTSAQGLLEQERKRTIAADQFTVSEAGLEELDRKLQRSLERTLADRAVDPDLEGQLRALVSHVLDSEREKNRAKEEEAQNAKIDLLEKKIRRLATTLEDTERQRDEHLQVIDLMEKHGHSAAEVRNVVAIGLRKDDENRQRKLEIMRELVEENRTLRRNLGIPLVAVAPAPVVPAAERAPEPELMPEPMPEPVAASDNPDDEPWSGEPVAATDNPDDQPWQADEGIAVSVDPDDQPWSGNEDEDEALAADGDPDDAPWSPDQPPATPREEPVDRPGIKRITAYKQFAPPPLHTTGA